jgi:glycine cleavage system aminomethyltransferase T
MTQASDNTQAPATAPMKRTPLYDAHVRLGARMVPFAGYDMPVQYEGVLAEHRWTRDHAGLFDVSHMGQAKLRGADPFASFEKLTPGDYQGLKPGKQRYSMLLNAQGGIVDDLMAASRRRRPVRGGQRRLQGRRLRPHRETLAGEASSSA